MELEKMEEMEKLEMGDARKGRYSGWWNPNHQAKLRLTLNYICVCVKMCFMLTVLWNGCYLVLAFPVLGFLNLTWKNKNLQTNAATPPSTGLQTQV